MKFWIASIMARLLYRMNMSVVINVKVNGSIHQKSRLNFMFGTDLNGKLYDIDGIEFKPPENCKYTISYENRKV